MEFQSKMTLVELSDGTIVRVEATSIGDRKIGQQTRPFAEATGAIESLVKDIADTVQKVKPDKASVKFGVEIGIDSGKLVAMLAKGTNTANLEITLEWNK